MKKISPILFFIIALLLVFYWQNKVPDSDVVALPVEFVRYSKVPRTMIDVEGKKYRVNIDLGTKMALSLNQDVLEHLTKEPDGISRRMDFRGHKYETPVYKIPTVKIGRISFKNIRAREESKQFVNVGSVVSDYCTASDREEAKNDCGRVGRDFFKGKNIYMDFASNQFILCQGLMKNIPLNEIPFSLTEDGIILQITTDRGELKLVLDTGSTLTAIRAEKDLSLENKPLAAQTGAEHSQLSVCMANSDSIAVPSRMILPSYVSSKFSMNGIDFGPRNIYFLEESGYSERIDGFLGMDFLREHVVFLDFEKNKAYMTH